ncbi:hypothetical protein [Microbulbifer pacificus]|uniref:Spore coat protein U domain-containing protein n=1 Tax=Microbulbifer pacificus TaxID=407164 RepID=A0AAU0N2B5_9GAMM|nr:hypothetical protein [Microbulbifer pacificus]WOX07117.1 hypothetical protein R5R33_08280 [Microbulbifer pacificus]
MKHLLGLGAAAALIVAGSAYAGGYEHDYGHDCYECSDSVEILLQGEIECSCEITFNAPAGYLDLNLLFSGAKGLTQVLNVDCNTDDDLQVIFESANEGYLVHQVDDTYKIPYHLLLNAANTVFGTQYAFVDGDDIDVYLDDVGTMAGIYSDTVTITVFVD